MASQLGCVLLVREAGLVEIPALDGALLVVELAVVVAGTCRSVRVPPAFLTATAVYGKSGWGKPGMTNVQMPA